MTNKIGVARSFAKHVHEGQIRKYTGEPYFNHAEAVANIIRSASDANSTIAIATAYLHDVVEDTPVTLELIRILFGDYIANEVDHLTDVSKPEDGNRKTRKSLDRAHNVKGSSITKIVKLADFIDNAKSIIKFDPEFAKTYMKEKRLLLEAFKENEPTIVNTQLWEIANEQLLEWEKTK